MFTDVRATPIKTEVVPNLEIYQPNVFCLRPKLTHLLVLFKQRRGCNTRSPPVTCRCHRRRELPRSELAAVL
jgi:hypothetical protein